MSAARLRLMPIVMTAAAALLALKAVGLATHTSYLFVPPAAAASAKAEEKPAEGGHGEKKAAEGHGDKEGAPAAKRPEEKPPVDVRGELAVEESSQKALVEALTKRREAMDQRASDLDLREATLKAAEKRIEDRLAELKRMEDAISGADKKRADEEAGKLKELVVLYESMKPKEAARIFEKLDPGVLLDVASRMKPRTLSIVLGQMAPDAAQKLTVALARREVAIEPSAAMAATELPKIEGKPTR